MRNILVFAAILAGLGTFMAQIADKLTPAQASATPAVKSAVVETPVQSSSRSLNIPHDARGHFQTEGRINGKREHR